MLVLINRFFLGKIRPVLVEPVDYYFPFFQNLFNTIPTAVQGLFFLLCLLYLFSFVENLRSSPVRFIHRVHAHFVYTLGIL
jgi:hypothetical protein